MHSFYYEKLPSQISRYFFSIRLTADTKVCDCKIRRKTRRAPRELHNRFVETFMLGTGHIVVRLIVGDNKPTMANGPINVTDPISAKWL